jgi:hypothetical protein
MTTGDWSGLWKLSLLTSLLQPLGLLLLFLLPRSVEDQKKMQASDARSRVRMRRQSPSGLSAIGDL